jgi:hypothetical protein
VTDYRTIHERIQEDHQRTYATINGKAKEPMKEIDDKSVSDMQAIKTAIHDILNKLCNIDKFLRFDGKYNRTYQGASEPRYTHEEWVNRMKEAQQSIAEPIKVLEDKVNQVIEGTAERIDTPIA